MTFPVCQPQISIFFVNFDRKKNYQKSVLNTIEYAKQLNSMFATFHVFTPQPGTKIFENYKDKLIGLDWEDFSYSNLVWKHDTLSKEFLDVTRSYFERNQNFNFVNIKFI